MDAGNLRMPDFEDNKWYVWGRFLSMFSNQATDKFGKFTGCFLSAKNMEQVQVFRDASCNEYTRQQYYVFKDVYGHLKLHPEIDPKTTNKEEKEKAKLTYNLMNPFDISNKSACRFNEKEIKEKK